MNSFIKNAKYLSRKITASRIGAYAAQTAFFMFMSLIPLIMLLFSLLSNLGASNIIALKLNDTYLPDIINGFLNVYFDEIFKNGPSMTVISVLILLWSASKGIYAIVGGLNSVYEIKENRNYFLVRLMSIFYTIGFMITLLGALSLLVFGENINNILVSLFPNIKGLVYLLSSLRFIIGFVILVLMFTIIYVTLPSVKLKFVEQIPGAVISSAGWVSFSILFSFFVENFSNYANIYGSLPAIIVLLLWLYVCMYIMFVGAKINHILSSKPES